MANKKYIYTIGRRKTSTAVIKLYPSGTGKFNIIK
jgi:ribosomal protein S9